MVLNRRNFLAQSVLRSGVLGCSLAASPLITPVSFAAAPWDHRLVVIILRGGMDGLDVVRPTGDPHFAALRPGLTAADVASGADLDLDGFYRLHPALAPLMPLWRSGDLGVVHAVSTPYRDKRSHFEGQDLLEAGTLNVGAAQDGWLNRMLQCVPGVEGETAFALGQMKVLEGAAPVANWHPKANMRISPQTEQLLVHVMEGDPLFEATLNEAISLSAEATDPFFDPEAKGMSGDMSPRLPQYGPLALAAYAAERLRGDTRIAAFSVNGWDTHARQRERLGRRLSDLAEVILTLQARLGAEVWGKTAVVAMTEFGRTARENGSKGTDHGTGGAMLLAGGAVRGGRVFGAWPGLEEGDLYDRRDLLPTADVRSAAAWILRGIAPLTRADLEAKVFPGLDMGEDPGLLS